MKNLVLQNQFSICIHLLVQVLIQFSLNIITICNNWKLLPKFPHLFAYFFESLMFSLLVFYILSVASPVIFLICQAYLESVVL